MVNDDPAFFDKIREAIEPLVVEYDRRARNMRKPISDADGAALSTAISLKRIADALDAISNGAAINVNNSY